MPWSTTRSSHLVTMATVCAVLAGTRSFAASAQSGAPPPTLAGKAFLTSPGAGWKLVWHDEFDGDGLDEAKWSIGLSWVGDDGTNRHHNNQYASCIADDDVVVSGGTLKLLTHRREVPNPRGGTYHFTEGLIQTDGKYRGGYGYYEMRARVPVEAGPGLWPAFWMLPSGWPPEMDIAEFWTSSNRFHQGLAYSKAGGGVGWDDRNVGSPIPAGWHTYGMEWGPGYQVYTVDGRAFHTAYGDHVPTEPMYILLNSGVESGSPPNASTVFPNAFEVDYVRVYSRPDAPVLLNGGFEGDSTWPWKGAAGVIGVAHSAHSGRQALRLDGRPKATEQKVYGLRPNTRYVASAWARSFAGGSPARLSVRDFGGEEAAASTAASRYVRLTVPFRTGPSTTTAVVVLAMPSGDGAVLFDDVRIAPR